MSFFKFETRACPVCGDPFEALTFWREDMSCGPCGTKAHVAKMIAYNAPRSYTIESIGGACPTQADGRTGDDRPYYFRARHGTWTLRVGEPGWLTDFCEWPARDTDPIASGVDLSKGFMDDEAVLAILDEHLGGGS